MKKTVLVMHGPNLGLLGRRRPEIYGTLTLTRLDALVQKRAAELGLRAKFFQSNGEGELIDWLEKNAPAAHGLLINPAAYTHYSYALRDAVEACGLPAAEVHLTDIAKREPFRRISVIKPVCLRQFKGGGVKSYLEALDFLAKHIRRQQGETA
ncbi:MAG: 3-dehydroquinate dehydratase II [Elusimicrobia bacterium]|nr:MAG: 3-dehydroquinate dehydratase II [Elusimicrobiota bacterium]KAF0156762.1 MAG: 3-dehydroquinate dehydratase II [Elusimicrobiota bacterium]